MELFIFKSVWQRSLCEGKRKHAFDSYPKHILDLKLLIIGSVASSFFARNIFEQIS